MDRMIPNTKQSAVRPPSHKPGRRSSVSLGSVRPRNPQPYVESERHSQVDECVHAEEFRVPMNEQIQARRGDAELARGSGLRQTLARHARLDRIDELGTERVAGGCGGTRSLAAARCAWHRAVLLSPLILSVKAMTFADKPHRTGISRKQSSEMVRRPQDVWDPPVLDNLADRQLDAAARARFTKGRVRPRHDTLCIIIGRRDVFVSRRNRSLRHITRIPCTPRRRSRKNRAALPMRDSSARWRQSR